MMSDEMARKSLNNDEVSFYDLLVIIKKRIGIILGISIVAIVLAGIISSFLRPVYRSNFIIRAPMLASDDDEPVVSIIETHAMLTELEQLRRDQQYAALAKRLGMDENKMSNLKRLETKIQATGTQKNFIELTAYMHDPQFILELKNGILFYLNQNVYVRERIELKKSSMTRLRDDIQSKIKDMEGLRNTVISQIKENKIKDLGFNPIGLDNEILNFKRRIEYLENEIKLLKGFEIAMEPAIPHKAVSPLIAVNMAIVGCVSVLLGIGVVIFIEWVVRNAR